MNREKYISNTSYREGYDDGKKEGASSTLAITMGFLNKLSNDIEYMKKILSDAINNEETIVEAKTDILDIRAEIASIDVNGQDDEHTMFIRTGEQVKQMALNIIDKYNTERYDKE